MDYVKRNVGARANVVANDCLERTKSTRRWPISYRSVEIVAIASDVAVIFLSSILSGVIYHLETVGQPGDIARYIGSAAVVSALFIPLMRSRDLYQPAQLLGARAQVRSIAVNWAGVFFFLAGVVFTLKIGKEFSRGAILLFAAIGFAALLVERIVWRHLLTTGMAGRKFSGRNIVLITDDAPAAQPALVDMLTKHGFQLKDHFVLPAQQPGARRRQAIITQIITYLRGSDIQEVMVSTDLNRTPELSNLLARLRILPLPITLIPAGATCDFLKRPSHTIGKTVCIEVQRGPLTTLERGVKRVLDILFAGTGLVLSLPLLMVVAIAIKMGSPGPVLFRQRRCGFNGKPFQIFKFRTMSVLDDGESIAQAALCDNRVTRFGKLLRRTSIDELPQLLNVLNGCMSLVGPRPHAVAHDIQFDKVVQNYAFRHHMKPGLTGWAQVHGYRGPTPTIADIEGRLELDLWYIDNWSFSLDFLIILRTIIEVVRGRNAY